MLIVATCGPVDSGACLLGLAKRLRRDFLVSDFLVSESGVCSWCVPDVVLTCLCV